MKPNAILLKLARINEENASRPNFVPLKIPQLKDLYNFLQIQRREMQENPTDADLNLSDLSNLTSPPQTQLSFPVSSSRYFFNTYFNKIYNKNVFKKILRLSIS